MNEIDKLILEWRESVARLDVEKRREADLRKQVLATVFVGKEEGTETLELGQGYKLKATYRMSYSLDSNADKVRSVLAKLPEHVSEHVVKWKPSLSKRDYDRLEGKEKKAMDSILTTKPGMPSLQLVEPKSAK